jgi:tetratricopeptide (TPR) repeat protein
MRVSLRDKVISHTSSSNLRPPRNVSIGGYERDFNNLDATSSRNASTDSTDFSEQREIAENLAKYGLYDEAIALYESVLEGMEKSGEQAFNRILLKSCRISIKTATMALKEEKQRKALDVELCEALCDVDEAQILVSQGKNKGAKPIYEKTLAGLYRRYGDYDYEIVSCLENLAISMGKTGYQTEEKELQGLQGFVLKSYLLRYGGYHPFAAAGLRNLGVILCSEREYQRAEACFRWAMEVYTVTLGAKSFAATLCHENLKLMEDLKAVTQTLRWPATWGL